MMNEQDIELLESYLDGALEPAGADELKARLANDAELSAELGRLESDRAVRLQLWQSYEAAPESAEHILAQLRKRESHRAWYWRVLDHRERIAAAAACVAVFLIGWQWGRNVNAYRMVPSGGNTQPVSLITQQQVPSSQGTIYEVRLNDASGKVVRVERFGTLQDAQRFIEELKAQVLTHGAQQP